MGVGFLAAGIVKNKIRERLVKDADSDLFTPHELNLAAEQFENAATGDDLNDLKNDAKQKQKAIEIFKRIKPRSDAEKTLAQKINQLYSIT